MGFLSEAAAYCAAIDATLHSLGDKIPRGLLVCRAACADLADRVHRTAAVRKVALSGAFTPGSLVSSVSKFLDRGLNVLMGGDSIKPAHSRSSSMNDGPQNWPGPTHSRGPSAVTSSGRATPPSGHHAEGDRVGGVAQPKLLSNLIGRVSSLKSLMAPSSSQKGGKEEEVSDNLFYYDHELKVWRERGVEPTTPPPDVGPPPTQMAWQAPPDSEQMKSASALTGGVGRYATANLTPPAVQSDPKSTPGLLPPERPTPFSHAMSPLLGTTPSAATLTPAQNGMHSHGQTATRQPAYPVDSAPYAGQSAASGGDRLPPAHGQLHPASYPAFESAAATVVPPPFDAMSEIQF